MTVKCYGSWTLQAARKKINKKEIFKNFFRSSELKRKIVEGSGGIVHI